MNSLPLIRHSVNPQERISLLNNTVVENISAQGTKILLTCSNNTNRQQRLIEVDYLIIAIGKVPRLEILGPELRHHYQSLIDARRLFLVGDVKNGIFRQATISVGDGIRTAMEIGYNIGWGQK